MRGLTLIEILLIVGILAILLILTIPVGLDFYRSQQLNSHTQGIIQTLRRAQLKEMSIEDDSNFGVYLTNDNYILFKGSSFNEPRDTQFDEIFDLPGIITVSGISEIVFSKFEGIPESLVYCEGTCIPCSDFLDRKACLEQDGCNWISKDRVCVGGCTFCDSFLDQVSCEGQSGCVWPVA